MGRGIKEYYPKIKEGIKGRFKKKRQWNWPELDSYCGYCSLSTGIYIRTFINLLVTAITIANNGVILSYILEIKPIISSIDLTSNEDYLALDRTNPEHDLSRLHLIYNTIIGYYLLWLFYKIFYVSALIWTFVAMLKKNGKMLKVLLYISVPNLILDIFISFLAALITRNSLKILFVVCILSEGYNILALNSQYKKIMGKSKVRHKDIANIEFDPRTQTMPPLPQRNLRNGIDPVHCSGCNCTASEPTDNGMSVITIQPSADPIPTTLMSNKIIDENKLNYAITGILTPINTEVNDTASNASVQSHIRPNTLDLTFHIVKDEKVMITDEPVIYDVNQLNIGTSPVIEDRERESMC